MKTWQMKLLIGIAIVYLTAGTVLGALVLTLTYRAEQATNALLTTGQTAGAKRLARAATLDQELICAVLRPALTNPKTLESIRVVIRKDCHL